MPIKSEVIANTKSERVHRVSELAPIEKGGNGPGRFHGGRPAVGA